MSFVDGESELMDRCSRGDLEALRHLLGQYLSPTYHFILFSTGCNRDQAFRLLADTVIDALRQHPIETRSAQPDGLFFRRLLSLLYQRSKSISAAIYDRTGFEEFPAAKRQILQTLREALSTLSFETKALLLFRDQINLGYDDIAQIIGATVHEVRLALVRARSQLRDRAQEILERAQEKPQ